MINRAEKVWRRLIEMYGSRVAENYGRDVPKPWADAIGDLSDEQIAFGLRAVMRESPAHPPALGQFVQCCSNMPVQQQRQIATIQEQLCEYAKIVLAERVRFGTDDFSMPWVFTYREWWDATRPKGMERCAECTGVVVNLKDGSKIGVSVEQMLADSNVHNQVMRRFRPGMTRPERDRKNWLDAQVDALKGTMVT